MIKGSDGNGFFGPPLIHGLNFGLNVSVGWKKWSSVGCRGPVSGVRNIPFMGPKNGKEGAAHLTLRVQKPYPFIPIKPKPTLNWGLMGGLMGINNIIALSINPH